MSPTYNDIYLVTYVYTIDIDVKSECITNSFNRLTITAVTFHCVLFIRWRRAQICRVKYERNRAVSGHDHKLHANHALHSAVVVWERATIGNNYYGQSDFQQQQQQPFVASHAAWSLSPRQITAMTLGHRISLDSSPFPSRNSRAEPVWIVGDALRAVPKRSRPEKTRQAFKQPHDIESLRAEVVLFASAPRCGARLPLESRVDKVLRKPSGIWGNHTVIPESFRSNTTMCWQPAVSYTAYYKRRSQKWNPNLKTSVAEGVESPRKT